MMQIQDKTLLLKESINRINPIGEKEYLIISNFGTSSVTSDSGFLFPFFRLFTPVKPEKGRKLNSEYMLSTPFDPFKESLMDYPTIVRHKLEKETLNWQNFNRLISIHIPKCPLGCWHCYLEECLIFDCCNCYLESTCDHNRHKSLGIERNWYGANKIVNAFLEQRKVDKTNSTNILRITGGEPFLVVDLILEILEIFRSLGLENEVFLWTETNLLPISNSLIVSDDHLLRLSQYKNFCIHPCFHGLSTRNFEEITGSKLSSFEILLYSLKRLLTHKLDIYPTFGSNVSKISEVKDFFYCIKSINHNLPLRFCLIHYDMDYPPIKERLQMIPGKKSNSLEEEHEILNLWLQLLLENFECDYGLSAPLFSGPFKIRV